MLNIAPIYLPCNSSNKGPTCCGSRFNQSRSIAILNLVAVKITTYSSDILVAGHINSAVTTANLTTGSHIAADSTNIIARCADRTRYNCYIADATTGNIAEEPNMVSAGNIHIANLVPPSFEMAFKRISRSAYGSPIRSESDIASEIDILPIIPIICSDAVDRRSKST